jgi:hypothetical protein
MRFLENFSNRYPDENQVRFWEEYLDKSYKFTDTQFGKMVQIDDKSYFLKNKGDITDRLFNAISLTVSSKPHEASLRRAIKNWTNKVNI